ncbi:RGT2-Sensor of high external glucose concentration [Fusarium beomiforme]|uniref:RGT2-Sensor of high external glucose concentration n=1 Tax=Fusarium beomiforme TaxID=44412 RepID=A0A9P5AIW9_9HYPO|nr:RGT2-Sensor of high external glucose concentration [Fusarium beomiforme]
MAPPIRSRGLLACFNGRLIYACSMIASSQLNFGMDRSAFSNTQAMLFFKRQFGTFDEATGTYVFLSLLNSVQFIGFVFGLVLGSLFSRRFGRRLAIFLMCFWALISGVILITSKTPTQAITGSTIAGSSEIKGHASWKIPYGLFFVIPFILAVAVWWIPEPPRWPLTRDRQEDALSSLRLRQQAYTEEEIQHKFQEMQNALNKTVKKGTFMDMWRGTNLKRTLITIGVNVFLQLTGQNFASKYGTIFIQSLDSVDPFVMSCINSALNIITVFFTQFLSDETGRVPLTIAGAFLQTASLMTMDGLGTIKNPSQSVRSAVVATVTLFGIGFSLGWAPLSHVVAAEIPTTGLRDLTYAVGAVFNIVTQWAIAFSVPYLIDKSHAGLGSKVGFIFSMTSFLAKLFSWFCIPECGGKTLEEIDELFAQGVPIRKFSTAKVSLDAEASDGGDDLTKLDKGNCNTHPLNL